MEGGGPTVVRYVVWDAVCVRECVNLCAQERTIIPFFSGSAVCGSIRGVLFGSTGLAVPKNCLYGAAQCLCSSLSP